MGQIDTTDDTAAKFTILDNTPSIAYTIVCTCKCWTNSHPVWNQNHFLIFWEYYFDFGSKTTSDSVISFLESYKSKKKTDIYCKRLDTITRNTTHCKNPTHLDMSINVRKSNTSGLHVYRILVFILFSTYS